MGFAVYLRRLSVIGMLALEACASQEVPPPEPSPPPPPTIPMVTLSPSGQGVSGFYVISKWRFDQLPGANPSQKLKAMVKESFYGPYAIGSGVPVEDGESIYVFPICGHGIQSKNVYPHLAKAAMVVQLACQ